jgi:nucleoside-diphosphate-sugar epimerase
MTQTRTIGSSLLDIPSDDLIYCQEKLGLSSWQALAGQRVFITGGTGFVGKWLLATLLNANELLGLGCRITVLSRNPIEFQHKWPKASSYVDWIMGDVRNFPIGADPFDIIIHAATDVVDPTSTNDVLSTCIDGTRHVLAFAKHCGARKILLVSSGAVYGLLPSGMTHVPETYLGRPNPLLAASEYAEGKRVSELLAVRAARNGLEVKIARVFALVGPHLAIDKHYAIGNFLRSAMAETEIEIEGDGTPYRSYLYAADMAIWLWSVLLRGKSGRAYNVGSDESLSIASLAERVKNIVNPTSPIVIKKKANLGDVPTHYVPDISRARQELGLLPHFNLDEAIVRTAHWHTEALKEGR